MARRFEIQLVEDAEPREGFYSKYEMWTNAPRRRSTSGEEARPETVNPQGLVVIECDHQGNRIGATIYNFSEVLYARFTGEAGGVESAPD
jgi:hypothetical protein